MKTMQKNSTAAGTMSRSGSIAASIENDILNGPLIMAIFIIYTFQSVKVSKDNTNGYACFVAVQA